MTESKSTLRIVHVITGLGIGGAEKMLYKLVKEHAQYNVEIAVISLGELGPIGKELQSLGVCVEALNMKRGQIPSISVFMKLVAIIRRRNTEVLQGWMYHGNIAVTIAGLFITPRPRIFWNIRQSLGSIEMETDLTRKLIRIGAFLSRIPTAIIYNSRASARQHTNIGYSNKRSQFIPNGFDISEFSYDNSIRMRVRRELGIDDDTILIGHIARFHPKKDHSTFLEAAKIVLEKTSDVVFLGVGRDVDKSNLLLWRHIEELQLGNSVILLGEKKDVMSLYTALDLFISSSAWGEGFPNTIGEAMAIGICCVVTDVGESKRLVGDTGRVVAPGDSTALGGGILDYIDKGREYRQILGQKSRERIAETYSIQKIGKDYLSLYVGSKDNI